MYLSRLWLNARSREVRRDLADPHEMHRTVMRGFPPIEPASDAARAHHGVLYRVDDDPRLGRLVLYVQARTEPDWRPLPEGYLVDAMGEIDNPSTTEVLSAWAALAPGRELAFRLRANPTRRIDTKSGPDGKRRNGKRVELRGDEALLTWLQRKAKDAGFALRNTSEDATVPDVRIVEERKLVGRRPRAEGDKSRLTFAPVLFEGVLRVADADAFRRALAEGIGPAKAFGFGLLSVQRAR
jgi:CRISPR system Cascade subunit CasE